MKKRTLTCISHGEQLLGILAIALTTKRFRLGEAQLNAVVIVRCDLTVSSLA